MLLDFQLKIWTFEGFPYIGIAMFATQALSERVWLPVTTFTDYCKFAVDEGFSDGTVSARKKKHRKF